MVWRASGFWWSLLGTPDLPSSDGGVLCDGGLLVETMNNVDPVVVVVVFCNRNGKFFF